MEVDRVQVVSNGLGGHGGIGGCPQLISDAFGSAGSGRGSLSHNLSVVSLCCLSSSFW